MPDDPELLRRYAYESSQEAFAELVRRHLDLVFKTALRSCGGDAHRAQDVAQVVFAGLASKAASLAVRPSLAGWLYTSTRYSAAQMVRSEARRQAREQKAHESEALLRGDESAADWELLKPAIDDALRSLSERDREAVLMRYFESRTLSEIGRQLRLTEDAARMRIDRGLAKMRQVLGRRGLECSAAALGSALEAQAAVQVPSSLAAAITETVLSGAAASGATAGPSILMSMTKLKIGVVLGLLAAGSVGLVMQHASNVRLRARLSSLERIADENTRLRAENERLSRQVPQGAPMAAGGSAAPAAPKAPPAAQPSGAGSGVPLAPGLVPVVSLGNAGRATARAAFATQLWAARTGDVALEASTLLLGPDERAKLEALLPILPPDVRAQYGTPEQLMAFALAGSPHPVGGMRVLGETDDGPDDVTLQTQWQHTDDSVVHQSQVAFHQDPDGWKMVVPPALVNRAAAYLGRL
jgi:RNA polymerase sigma factor (sigma-70 family)